MRVDELNEGDIVDLEGDYYADEGFDSFDGGELVYEYYYATVSEITKETEGCTLVTVECGGGEYSIGFPPDHEVNMKGSDR